MRTGESRFMRVMPPGGSPRFGSGLAGTPDSDVKGLIGGDVSDRPMTCSTQVAVVHGQGGLQVAVSLAGCRRGAERSPGTGGEVRPKPTPAAGVSAGGSGVPRSRTWAAAAWPRMSSCPPSRVLTGSAAGRGSPRYAPVGVGDEFLEHRPFDPPRPAAADLDPGELAAPDQPVDVAAADVEFLADLRQGQGCE